MSLFQTWVFVTSYGISVGNSRIDDVLNFFHFKKINLAFRGNDTKIEIFHGLRKIPILQQRLLKIHLSYFMNDTYPFTDVHRSRQNTEKAKTEKKT